MKKTIIQIGLSIIIIILAYLVYRSVMQPVRFNREKDIRSAQVVQGLKDIRIAEIAYKSINRKYTSNFDSLLYFVENGEIPVIKMIPDPNDTTFTKTILDTIGYIPVYDSLFSKRVGFRINDLPVIPFSGGQKFKLDAGEIERSKVRVQVFEASALNEQFLTGLNPQLINNMNDKLSSTNRFVGLKVGSMIEATTDGNWE
jgi:hypothetical protein